MYQGNSILSQGYIELIGYLPKVKDVGRGCTRQKKVEEPCAILQTFLLGKCTVLRLLIDATIRLQHSRTKFRLTLIIAPQSFDCDKKQQSVLPCETSANIAY